MPTDLASKFPVTWLSTDTSAGTIDANGLFTAVGPGTTDVIASVSTGLSVRVTVRVDILLTSISLAIIPEQVAGNTYGLKVTKTPSNATESISYASTDSAVASVTTDGQLIAAGKGTATISVAGALSGKSANQVVKVTAAPIVEVYLKIDNHLSEIATEGTAAQEKSQRNMGLGVLATKNALTAKETGAVPVADKTLPAGTDLNNVTEPGEYFQNVTSNATLALNYPVAVAGVLKVYRTGVDETGCRQVYMPYNSTVEYRRYAFGEPLVFSHWNSAGGAVAFGEVGCFAFCKHQDTSTQHNMSPGSQWAGSDLRFAGTIVLIGYPIPAGTWVACGGATNVREATVFQRIA